MTSGPEGGRPGRRCATGTWPSATTPCDELDARWDLSGPVEDLEAHYQVGWQLAGGTAWPNWRQGSEFRAARDPSLGGAN